MSSKFKFQMSFFFSLQMSWMLKLLKAIGHFKTTGFPITKDVLFSSIIWFEFDEYLNVVENFFGQLFPHFKMSKKRMGRNKRKVVQTLISKYKIRTKSVQVQIHANSLKIRWRFQTTKNSFVWLRNCISSDTKKRDDAIKNKLTLLKEIRKNVFFYSGSPQKFLENAIKPPKRDIP